MLAERRRRGGSFAHPEPLLNPPGSPRERPPFRYASGVFIPLGTDRDAHQRPYVLWALLVINVAVHVAVFMGFRQESPRVLDLFDLAAMDKDGFRWWQPFTYQFLHDPYGIAHVASNMIFLLAFGRVVESRLGHLGFLALYLAGGALAGLLQIAMTGGSVIGASGSVSVVAGAFLALHPLGYVHGLWLLPPSRVTMPAAWLLGLYAAIDLVNTFTDFLGATRTGVGTIAHLGGLVFGLLVCVALLGFRLLPRNDYDLFFMLKQWKRRRELRAAAQHAGVGVADRPVAARVRAGASDDMSPRERTLRATIASAYGERDLVLCASLYRDLIAIRPDSTLPSAIQLDVANQLAHEGDAAAARTAYSLFVSRFRNDPSAPHARLMLAVIELRRLRNASAALETLASLDHARLDKASEELADSLEREARALAGGTA